MRRLPTAGRMMSRTAAGFALATLVFAAGADGLGEGINLDAATRQAHRLAEWGVAWYHRTPPSERITWGGLAACTLLGLTVAVGRSWRLSRRRVLPASFVDRFLNRLRGGNLDQGKGTDLCELNPSPAARVALAAIRRWGRPAADLERAVALARQVEADQLRRHVGTLRRVAALSPLIGLLGTLLAAGRALSNLGTAPAPAWGPALAQALAPLTAGVALAILSLVAYDGLAGRVETLANGLDRLGAETVDAIVSAVSEPRGAHTPHQVRVERAAIPPRTPIVD